MVVASVVRRGMELASAQDPEQPNIHFSGWLAGLFVFTVLAFVFCLFKISYTYGMLIPTLAAVEESNPDVYVRIDANLDPTKPNDDPTEIAAETAAPKPITSKLRTTIKHLRARGGFWSRFRGFSMYMTYIMSIGFVSSFLPISPNNFVGQVIGQIAVLTLLANLHVAWIHIVISEPSPKRFYQRIPGYKVWLKIAPVAALTHGAVAVSFYLPLILTVGLHGWNWMESEMPNEADLRRAAAAMIFPSLLSFFVAAFAGAIFVRVAASMLPDEEEAIVPFDRSFGGKVVPALLGGSGKLGVKDAWTTFDRAARVRYLKAVGKAFAMLVSVIFLFTMILGGLVYAGALSIGNKRD